MRKTAGNRRNFSEISQASSRAHAARPSFQARIIVMKIDTLSDMFAHTLKDIHYAETKILKALPKMIKAADDTALKEALTEHKAETEGQIERIKEVFALLKMKPAAEECDAINGIIKEAEGMMEDTQDSDMRDCAVIASGQAVEHYEMVRYRSLVMWAGALGLEDAVPLLQQSLEEEQRADEKLLKFAAYCQSAREPEEKTAQSKPAGAASGKSKNAAA
jgi:ferritin-like metal-binding protein YciE